MKRIRFNIASLLVIIFIHGVGLAALRESSDLWDSGIFTVTIGVLLISILLAVHRIESRRAFWIGFALFGSIYLGLSMVPAIESRLMTTKALAYLDSEAADRKVVTTALPWTWAVQTGEFSGTVLGGWSGTTENFVRIGHSLLALLAAWIGGHLSRRLYQSSRSPQPTLPVEAEGIAL
jgi:hypothetical protein